jgi:septum formation protein
MLVLASTSTYRRELLARLRVPFEVARPDIDESPHPGEPPVALAERLAAAKGQVISRRSPRAWVIGADQVAEIDGQVLSKPGSFERAADQLAAASGRRVVFHTAACLLREDERKAFHFRDRTEVVFRRLDAAEIERYLHAEQPYDCAGSFKCEGLGITLFEAIHTRDPTALIGLPLIDLAKALRQAGFALP